MKHELRFIIIWLVSLLLLRLSLFLPHRDLDAASLLNVSLQLLSCIMCIDIAINSYREQRHVYLLFALFFAFSILLFGSSFVGKTLFQGSYYGLVYYHVYVNKFGENLILLFGIMFALISYFTRLQTIVVKYVISLALALLIMLPLYTSFLLNPLQLYHEDEYAILYQMNNVSKPFIDGRLEPPSDTELAKLVLASDAATPGEGGADVGDVEKAVAKLRPFMNEGGMSTIFWKPLNVNSIYVHTLIAVFLCFFFVVNYFYGKAHSAYLDKILLLFFVISLVEIVHLVAYISSSTLANYQAIFTVGQYVTVVCLMLMVYAFELRLRFVLSSTGKYYEEVLQSSPEKITRWRDEVDNVILKSFFNIKKYNKQLGHYNDNQ